MKVSKTYREIFELSHIIQGRIDIGKEDKLTTVLKTFVKKQYTPAIDNYNEMIADFNIDFCSTDKDGNIIKDEKGGFVFTKENLKQRNAKVKELLEKTYEFDTRFVEMPDNLTEEEKEAFSGLFTENEKNV